MWSRRRLSAILGVVAVSGCAGSGSGDFGYGSDPIYDDDWIYYYDEDDEDFLAGLTDEQKAALKAKWDSLSPDEKQQIRDRWDDLDDGERSRVRQAWGGLDAEQRERVVSSMQSRARSGTLSTVTPMQAGPSRFPARPGGGFDRGGLGGYSLDRGSMGGRAGGGLGGRGGGSFGGGGGGGRGR
jgi:hypothetical protein